MTTTSSIRHALAALGLAATVLPASAALITYQSRFSTDAAAPAGTAAAQAAYYQATVNVLDALTASAGYCDASLASTAAFSNHALCAGGSTTNLAFHLGIDFGLSPAQSGAFSLQIGPDFGKGGAVFLDGGLLGVRTSDMWWAGGWGSPSQIFEFDNLGLLAGSHHIDVYGLEACCDGDQQARFRLSPTADWQVFSRADALRDVPEPALWLLILAATAGLVWTRRAPG